MTLTIDLTSHLSNLFQFVGVVMSDKELAEFRKIVANHDLITIKIEPADEGIERRHSGR